MAETATAPERVKLTREPLTFVDKLHRDFCARLWSAADEEQRDDLRRAPWFVMPTTERGDG